MILTDRPIDAFRRLMRPHWGLDRAERRAWRQITSWPDLCQLMAAYVESLDSMPHEETLVRTTQAGYLVHTARPAGITQTADGLREGRAAVFGFVLSMDLYDVLARVAETHGLILLARSVRDHDEAPGEVVVRIDGVDSVQIGESKSMATLRDEWQHLGQVGHELLYGVRQVTLIDPVWGRDDLLWQALDEAIDLYEAAA